jgi:hypothetical protein
MLTENYFHHIQLIDLRSLLNLSEDETQGAGIEEQWPWYGVICSITSLRAVVDSEAML